MFTKLCNEFCIRVRKEGRKRVTKAAEWLASSVGLTAVNMTGMKLVNEEAIILPTGFLMFDNQLAKEIGVERAAIYQKLKSWQEHNCRKNMRSHFRHDRWWTYGSPKYWLDNEFIWSSLSTVRRAFSDLEKAGLLLVNTVDDKLWLSALTGESVKMTLAAPIVQQGLFNLDSEVPNRRSSIENQTTLKQTKKKKQTTISPRKAAVADFTIPEARNKADFEIHESREGGSDGHDELFGLPMALRDGWTDANTPLETVVAQHGIERVNEAYAKAQGFRNRIAGTRTILAKYPSPRFAPPPSPAADDSTEQDWTADEDVPENMTPAIDDYPGAPVPMTSKQQQLAWAKTHCGPAIYAQIVAELEAEENAQTN